MTDDTGGPDSPNGTTETGSSPSDDSLDRHQPASRVPGFAPGVERIGTALLVGTLATAVLFTPLVALLPAVLVGFVLYFFRDPDRSPPDARVVAPADGRVSVVREEGDRVRVGVFMNVTDVHVNRAPADGEVVDVTHRPGANKPAFSKDSDRNERVDIDCGDYELSLIAGWFARRIHPYVAEGDSLRRGERVGHIDFGSRADVLLPAELGVENVAVEEGDTVRAGETVLVE
jgi:phosphatidylserine decarboxylase